MIYRARFLVPVDGPPLENGAIAVVEGRIAAVGPYGDIAKSFATGNEDEDFGDAVIVPGFVNAHTHLELTDLADRVPPTADFTAWLQALFAILTTGKRDERTITNAVHSGVRLSNAAGVTALGDITRYPAWSRGALGTAPIRVVSFGEVAAIGCRRNLLNDRLNAATSRPPHESEPLRLGISPHAPYTVEPAALHECLRTAKHANLPVCMHLAETDAEESFTRNLSGAFADYLRDLGLWDGEIQAYGFRPVEILNHYTFPLHQTVLAHVNYTSDADIATLARHGASVAYCPRTHAAFGHPPHRFRDMLAAGVNVCLGTDSLASNPSLSVLEELQFLHVRFPEMPTEVLLHMATINGARALGLDSICGSLTVGKSADFGVIALPRAASKLCWTDICEAGHRVNRTHFAGESANPSNV